MSVNTSLGLEEKFQVILQFYPEDDIPDKKVHCSALNWLQHMDCDHFQKMAVCSDLILIRNHTPENCSHKTHQGYTT